MTTVKGTFIKVTQFCMLCHYKFVWESLPFYGSFPAGNILLSASILFTGLMPTKVLRMLKYFGCATIGRKTFFRHQRDILQPAIHVQWRKQQQFLFHHVRSQNKELVLARDGRADSPGHSAKYGSYTVIDVVLIDIKLVQVLSMQWLIHGAMFICFIHIEQ